MSQQKAEQDEASGESANNHFHNRSVLFLFIGSEPQPRN
jgi:hypothetical protein